MGSTRSRRMQYVAASAVNLLTFSAGICVTWSSPVIIRMMDPDYAPLGQPLSETDIMWLGSLVPLGSLLALFPNALLAEKIGRKWTLLSATIPFFVGWILIGTAPSIQYIFGGRIVLGMACGYVLGIVPTYMAEIAEEANRGGLSALAILFLTCGMLFSYSLGPYLDYIPFTIACAIPCLLFCAFFVFMPESPYYYMGKGKYEEAIKSLTILRGQSEEDIENAAKIIQEGVIEEKKNPGSYEKLFTVRNNFKALRLIVGANTLHQLTGIGAVLVYTEYIFKMTGSNFPSEISSIIMGVIQVLSALLPPLISNKVNRKTILMMASFGSTLSMAGLGLCFYFSENNFTNIGATLNWLPIVCLIFFAIAYNCGSMMALVAVELFPTNLRTRAAVISTINIGVVTFLVTRYFGALEALVNTSGTFWIYSLFGVLFIPYIYFCIPETKGFTFQEIQNILSGVNKNDV